MKINKLGTFVKYLILFLFFISTGMGAETFAADRWVNENKTDAITGITDSIYNAVSAKGGAIYYDNGGDIGIISGTYTGNKAQSTGSGNYALGGAIYSKGNITINADSGATTIFSNNFTVSGAGKSEQNAIFMDTSAGAVTLTLNSHGTIQIDDTIDGGRITNTTTNRTDRGNRYNLVLTGDDNGVIKLNNTVYAAEMTLDAVTLYLKSDALSSNTTKLTANSGAINFVDNTPTYNTIRYLVSSENVKYYFDVDAANNNIDRITTDSSSSGTVTIGGFNFISDVTEAQTFTKVLDNTNMVLAIAQEAAVKKDTQEKPNIKFSDKWTQSGAEAIKGTLGWDVKIYKNYVFDTNPLKTLNTTDYGSDRTYAFDGTAQTYVADSSFGVTDPNSNLTISGYADGTSKIDANRNQLFTMNDNATNIGVSKVEFTKGYSSTNGAIFNNNAGSLTISNSKFTSNSAVNAGAIYNAGTLEVNNSTFSGNMATTSAGAIYNEGTAVITNTIFNNNSAINGGAIYNTGSLNISGSTFETANDTIYNNGVGAVLTIDGTSPTVLKSAITGTGTLNLDAQLDLYGTIDKTQVMTISQTGALAIYNATNPFVFDADNSTWLGTINLAVSGASLEFNSGSFNIVGTLLGATGSKFKNTGSDITIKNSANVGNFNGSYEQTGGSLSVALGTNLFKGEKNINGGSLNVDVDSLTLSNINMGSNTSANINTTQGGTVDNSIFNFVGTNSIVTFGTTGQSTINPTYTLGNVAGNYADSNTIKFTNSVVKFGNTNYTNNKYAFENTVIDLADGKLNSYVFENLVATNSELKLDIDSVKQ